MIVLGRRRKKTRNGTSHGAVEWFEMNEMVACSRKIAFICVQMNMKILSLAVRQGERGI